MALSRPISFLIALPLFLAGCAAAGSVNENIHVLHPAANAIVKSPLMLQGEARGNWYFEASFPVRLLDAQGKEIAVTQARAQGDWMTTEFVPFTATLNFTTIAEQGMLVLEKDNPSGLPQNAASIVIPVKFR